MNRIKVTILILCLQCICTLGSCQKPPKPIPPIKPPAFPTNLEVVWNAPIYSDSVSDIFLNHVFAADQYVVVANMFDSDGGKPRGIGVYNKQTGERHSAWKNDPGGIFTPTELEDIKDCKIAGKNKDIILIYSGRDLLAYSLHSGQRMWGLTDLLGEPEMTVTTDHVFIPYGQGTYSASWKRIAIVDVYSGVKRDVVELYAEDNYEICISTPSAYVNSERDTLLYYVTDAYNFSTAKGRIWAYCYNLTKKEMVWVNKQFTTSRSVSTAQPPPIAIENDKLIVASSHAIHCLNRLTGKLIWQKETFSMGGTMPHLYRDGWVYLRYGNPTTLLCLDAQTGQEIWKNTEVNPYPAFHGAMDIYDGKLYCSASGNYVDCHLVCVDAQTGKTLWVDGGPTGHIAFGVLIDQKTGYLYCNTGWSLMCVDLKKTPRK